MTRSLSARSQKEAQTPLNRFAPRSPVATRLSRMRVRVPPSGLAFRSHYGATSATASWRYETPSRREERAEASRIAKGAPLNNRIARYAGVLPRDVAPIELFVLVVGDQDGLSWERESRISSVRANRWRTSRCFDR